MLGLGPQELLIILVIILVIFGADKIPKLARSLGKGITEFRQAQKDVRDEMLRETDPVPAPVRAEETCPSCRGRVAAGALFCAQCGKELAAPPVCPACQHSFFPEEKFCPNCGQAREGGKNA